MVKKDGLTMLNISSSEFKKQMGAYLSGTHEEPIQIEKETPKYEKLQPLFAWLPVFDISISLKRKLSLTIPQL